MTPPGAADPADGPDLVHRAALHLEDEALPRQPEAAPEPDPEPAVAD